MNLYSDCLMTNSISKPTRDEKLFIIIKKKSQLFDISYANRKKKLGRKQNPFPISLLKFTICKAVGNEKKVLRLKEGLHSYLNKKKNGVH